MYKINYNQIIRSEKLNSNEKILLLELLIIKTKENSRKHIQNGDLQRVLGTNIKMFRKTRDQLESQKLISILPHRAQRKGKPLHYKIMWTKLVRWNLVEKIQNEYQEKFYDQISAKKKHRAPMKEGTVLNSENVLLLNDEELYDVKYCPFDYYTGKARNSRKMTNYGKRLKSSIKIEANSMKSGEPKQFEYVYLKKFKK